MRFSLLFMSLLVLAASCKFINPPKPSVKSDKDSKKPSSETASAGQLAALKDPHTILVMDQGFDHKHDVFKDKVIGAYTMECSEYTSAPEKSPYQPKDNSHFELSKAKLISAFSRPNLCKLREGIALKKDPRLFEITKFREEWNARVKNKQPLEGVADFDSEGQATSIKDILSGVQQDPEAEEYSYHGTGTASLIAYKNPGVKLILVEMDLASLDGLTLSECTDQDRLDLFTRLYSDKDVIEAYRDKPLSEFESSINDLIEKHNVTIINKSFGFSSRAEIERWHKEKCGVSVEFRKVFQALGEALRQRALYLHKSGKVKRQPLTVYAAGNDGDTIDSLQDAFECSDHELNTILSGSYKRSGDKSTFSNVGKCVDLYAIGSVVVIAAPENFLTLTQGTSFSAPLSVRYISRNFPASMLASEIIKALPSHLDTNRHLTKEQLPLELIIDT